MKTPSFLIRPVQASLFWGFIGGLCLIGISFLTNKGIIQILPYPFILVTAILLLKYNDKSNKVFIKMLLTGFSVFVIMSIILILYVAIFENPDSNINFKGYLWRFGFVIGAGFLSSLLLSILAKPVKNNVTN